MEPLFTTLASALEESGFATRLLPAGGEVPFDHLLVLLGEDEQGRTLQLELAFLPQVHEPRILQYFIALPYSLHESSIAALARFAARLNGTLPLTGFGLDEVAGMVYFRHLMPYTDVEESAETVVDTMTMCFYLVERFGPLVEAVAAGDMTAAEGFERLEQTTADGE